MGGSIAILAAIASGTIAIYHFFYPDTPWRTQADKICLAFIDEYHDAGYKGLDQAERFDLWPKKLERLWKVDVPVEYELLWRKYLNSEGDLETVYAESYDEKSRSFDIANRVHYGYQPTLESFKNVKLVPKQLNLQVCGEEMWDTGYFVAFEELEKEYSSPPSSTKRPTK